MDILKGFIDIVSNPAKAIGDAVGSVANGLAEEEARRRAEEEERKKREEEERRRAEEEKRKAEEEERIRRAEEARQKQEQLASQRQNLQKETEELVANRQNMSDDEFSRKRQELTLKDNGFNDLQSKLDAEKYGNSKVSDSLKINGEGEEGRHQFNVGKIAHKLFDGSDADNLSVEQMGKHWSELGGNDQQDIMANLKTLQYRYTQENKAKEAESTARLMADLERYGGKAKDRDFLNSLVTNAKHGGFAGDIASNIEQTLGNVTGQGEKFREILNARQNDMDSLDGWNKAGNTIGNIVFDTGANLVSGGAKMALDTGMGAINVGEKALDEKTLDENGKIRNHNLEEQAGLIGSELVTDGLRLAGAKGLTPSLDKVADLMRSGSGIKQILPEVAKYGAKELGTVLPTSYLQTNLNVMGNGGHFGEAKLEDIAKDTAMNIGTDLAMDIRSGLGRARTGGDVKQLYHDGKLLPNTGLTPNAGRNARMAEAIDNYPISEPFNYGRLSKEQVARHNSLNDGFNPLQTRDLTVNPQQFNPHIEKRISQGVNPEDLTKITENAIYGDNSQILSGTTNPLNRRYVNADNPSSVAIIGNDNGETTLRSFYPRKTDNIKSDIAKDTAVNSQNMATHLQEMGAINNIPQNSNDVNNSSKYKLSSETEDVSHKQAQFDLLQKTNPMLDDYHTGIRKPEEIKTLQEVIKHHDPDEDFAYPDFELKDAQKAMDNGKITIYSSYPIKEGVFVSPSKMMAQDYAGGRELYSKEVDLKDIGWINSDEGNYLPVNNREDLKFQKQQSINYELATKQDLLSRHLELTGDEKLAFNEWQNAMQKKALGYYNPETDSINLNRLSIDTLNHEIGHKMLTKVENKEELLSEIKRAYGEDNLIATYGKLYGTNDLNLLAEEKLADGFTDYYNGIKNGKDIRILGQELRIPPKVLAIYDRIMEAIKGLIGKQDQIKQFYAQMETGKFRENNGLANISEQTAYKIHDTPNGKYVEIEGDPLEGVPYKDIPRKVKQVIAERFQGNSYQIGDTDNYAGVTARSKRELAYKQQQMNGLDYVKKATMSHNLDELIESMSSVRTVPNLKKDAKPNVAGYIYGDVDVKIGSQIFTARVNIEQNVNGQKIIYDISNIKRGGGESAAKLNSLPRSSNTNSIPQNGKDVNDTNPENRYLLNPTPDTNTPPKKQGIVKNLKIADGEINDFIKDQVKKQNNQNKVPLKEKLADNVANLKHYLIDDAVAYERYTKDKVLKKELREGIDRVRSSETIATQFIRDTGLSEALGKMSKKEQNEFGQYLIAKRHLEVADRDIATGRDLAVDKAIVEKFKDKYSQAEEVYRNHNKAMLEHMAEHGLISSELKDKLIAENPNYAPLQRIMDEAENFSGNSKQLGNLSNQSVVKGLKGSERVVDNPLEATLNNTFRMINEVERNKVARSLAENVFGGDNVEVTRDMPNWAKQPNMDIDSYSPRGETVNKIAEDSKGRYVENTEYKNVFEDGQELKERAKTLQNFLNDNFRNKTYQDENSQDIEITKKGINKAISLDGRIKDGDIRGANQNAHVELDNIIRTSRRATEEEINRLVANKTVNTKAGRDFEYNYVRFKDNGNEYEGLLNVANYKGGNGDIFYGIKPIKKSPVDGPEGIRPEALKNNLPDRKGIVKGLRFGETEKLAYLDNGKKVEIEVPKLVAKEMKNLNGVLPDGLDKVISVLAMPAKTLRAGATGLNPIFVASNLVRDQIQSAISGGVISSIKGTPKALLATFGRGEKANVLKAELARAGLGGSEYRMTYGGNKGELLKQLQAEHKWANGTMEKLRHPINTLADIIGITENFTRAQQYFGTNGDELAKAQASRNNTLNFSRGGSVVKVLNKIIPFLNAGVQGGRQTVNLVKERPVHTGVATAVIGGVILAADAINKSDERRKELWDRVSDSDKKTNIIAFTPDAHYNPETNRIEGLIKIPMPQIFYPLLDLQNAKGTIPEKGLKIASDIFTAVSGIDVDNPISQLTPTAVKPMLEQFTNKNFFTGRELVSDYDKNKRPDEKGAKYSSGIARGIANLTGIDAPVVDNYITGFTGSLGGDMAKTLTDNPDNAKDGKGIGDYINNGIYRRFLSTNITSQNQIAEDKAKKAKDALNNDPTFKNMSREDQVKVLNAIDNDFSKIASTLAKKEQNHEDEIKKDLNDRQKALIDGNFEAGKYAEAIQAGKEGGGSDNKYGKKDNKKAFYKQADAEYEDFKKEFAEKSEKGEYSRLQKIEAEHKLKRLELTKDYDKDVRDSYGASRTNLYKLYGILSGEEKENLKGKLNGINDIMLKNGEISQKEYDSKYKIINEIESVKGVKGGRGQKGGVGYVKGLKVEAGKLPEFKMENAPKIKGGESKLKTTGIVKGLTLNSKANKEGQVGLKRVRVTIR